MGHPQIKNILSDLKLNGMLSAFEELNNKGTKNSWTALEFLDHLLQVEAEWRERQSAERKIKNSKLLHFHTLEDFDFAFSRNITKAQIRELYSLQWLDQSRPLLLIGPTGVGKTFVAEALGHHICQRKKSVLFLSMSDLLEQQHLAHVSGSYLKYKAKLTKYDLIILDDLGLRKLTTQEAHDFCELIKERPKQKSLIITSQVPLKNWPEILEDPVVADTITDRLKNISVKISLSGKSYRELQGQKFDTTSKQV
ncbi:MAG: ATP-binding protein [Bdellovibrionales bacterium]|jgi:DNA replication protein DnaC|nr:ATP-binding protein [Bdellovibrionales bacterium]